LKTRPSYILPLIVISQFAGTSLWFAGNAILPELQELLTLDKYAISKITTAVQLGFIAGTLLFAVFSIADRFSPSKIFFISACIASLTNLLIIWIRQDVNSLLVLRFFTGFFLAGIYPVGMKIASDWYEKGLGTALGYLVGALVLGTAFPYLLKNRTFEIQWKTVLYCSSLFAISGGLLILFSGDGPNRTKSTGFRASDIFKIFRAKKFRAAAFGYFGHMWELYTFWGFIPLILQLYSLRNHYEMNIPLLSFIIIGAGSISCVAAGYLSNKIGSTLTASVALAISGICCFLSPLMFSSSPIGFLIFLVIWGLAVIADSPQFSTLVTKTTTIELRGTALTFVTSIGFAITVISLLIIDRLFHSDSFLAGYNTFIILGIGPLLGLLSMIPLFNTNPKI
jgi:MFS family permease